MYPARPRARHAVNRANLGVACHDLRHVSRTWLTAVLGVDENLALARAGAAATRPRTRRELGPRAQAVNRVRALNHGTSLDLRGRAALLATKLRRGQRASAHDRTAATRLRAQRPASPGVLHAIDRAVVVKARACLLRVWAALATMLGWRNERTLARLHTTLARLRAVCPLTPLGHSAIEWARGR